MSDRSAERRTPVVGIGASSGGLGAFQRLVGSLPADAGLAYVLVQHLAPGRASRLPELLAEHTDLPVRAASDGDRLEPDRIYVIPSAVQPTLHDGVLRLAPADPERGTLRVVDQFLRSLADDLGERSIGVILSGEGRDGAAGLEAIRAAGGLTLTQAPDDAAHAGMPSNAAASGAADLVLPLAEIPTALEQFAAHPYLRESGPQSPAEEERAEEGFDVSEIVGLLRADAAFDPGSYRPTTIRRRIQRRMGVRHVLGLDDYANLLRKEPEELGSLLRDLLISVTDFFRDERSFEYLRTQVVPELVTNAQDGRLRVWVPACATGEEAYSLAICLLEEVRARGADLAVQVFATDVDQAALQVGRRGVYGGQRLESVSRQLVARYFSEWEDGGYRVSRALRDCVSFAPHDVLRDAPFSNLDLLSCRNLLIYLKREVQREVLGLFHLALRREGILFLGGSENPHPDEVLFSAVSKEHRVFRRAGRDRRAVLRRPSSAAAWRVQPPPPRLPRRDAGLTEIACRLVLDSIHSAAAVIDHSAEVLFLHGDMDRFLRIPRGEVRVDLFSMLRDDLRARVRAGVSRCMRSGEPVSFLVNARSPDDHHEQLQVRAVPAELRGAEGLLTVVFEALEPPPGAPTQPAPARGEDPALIALLERELEDTRRDLRATLDELEISNDELKASNEESLSMNEELQSSNEELEASAEELRLLNEELTALNQRLQEKVEELEVARDDLENFFTSTRLATAFLDVDLQVQRFTPEAARLLGLGDGDTGRPFVDFVRRLDPHFAEAARDVLETLAPDERELETSDQRWLRRSILPYRTNDDRIRGLVVTFTDITDLKHALEESLHSAHQQASSARLGLEALQRSASLGKLIQLLPGVAAETLGVEFAKVLELQPDGERMLLRAGVGWNPGLVGRAVLPTRDGSQAGYTLGVHEPVVVRDLRTETRFSGPELLLSHGVRSGMSVLVEGPDGAWGVLGVHSRRTRDYSERDVAFLQGVANILATAVQRDRAERALRTSEERLRSAKQAAELGIHDFDPRTNTVEWDLRVRELWGVPLDEEPITYETFREGVHPADRERVDQEIQRALQPGGDARFDSEYRVMPRGSDEIRWILATGDVTFEDGEAVRLIGTVQDVTERKQNEEQLRAHARRLEEEDKRKELFLATLGHELRNPLAALDSAVMAIERGASEPQALQPMMAGHVRQLSSLVNDLLEVSRISQGKLAVKLQPTRLAEVLEASRRSVESGVARREQQLEIVIDDDCWVAGDATRLEQVVTNLLANASKYTPEKGRIRAVVDREVHEAVLTVQDTGRGLRLEQLTSIFEPFVQEEPGVGGLGIGLSLVKGLVELHHGSVEAWSAGPGSGSTFVVRLPAAEPARQKRPEPAAPDQRLPTGTRLLVVDDARDNADMLALLLRGTGAEVVCAYDGASALEQARACRPHVALVDIGLPDMSGYEVATTLRAAEDTRDTLLVAVTGFGDTLAEQNAREAGFYARLVKPVPYAELVALIARHLERVGTDGRVGG